MISSPFYPNDYKNYQSFSWIIEVANYNIIELNFTHFHTQSNQDFVQVFDGLNSSSESLGKFSGSTNPGMLLSNGSQLLIRFTSDGTINKQGFQASFKAGVCYLLVQLQNIQSQLNIRMPKP